MYNDKRMRKSFKSFLEDDMLGSAWRDLTVTKMVFSRNDYGWIPNQHHHICINDEEGMETNSADQKIGNATKQYAYWTILTSIWK